MMKNTTLLFLIVVSFLIHDASLKAQSWDLKQKLGSSDQAPADNLGISVAISDS